MAKRRRESDSDVTTRRMECYTVFVDTSLDTSFAMLVSDSNTVADFKKKLESEHKLCYPETEIHIRYLEVKRSSRFYRISDRMLVWNAFQGVKRSWHLWADASGTRSTKTMGVGNVDNNCGDLSSGINRMQAFPVSLLDGSADKNDVLDRAPRIEFENSLEKTTDIQNCKETESPAKKKLKTRHTKYACHDPCSEGSDDLSRASSKDIVIPNTVDAVKEGINAEEEVSVVRNDGCVNEGRVAIEGTSVLGIEKKGTLGSISSDIDYFGSVYVKLPETSAGLMDDNGTIENVNSTLIKRKRKKAQEAAVNIQDAPEVEEMIKGKNIKPSTETHNSERMEEEKHLTQYHDHEDEMPPSYKAGSTQKKVSKIKIPSKKKKKKMKIEKMSDNTNLKKSGAEQIDKDISNRPSGLLCLPICQIPVATDKEESTMECQNPIGEKFPEKRGNKMPHFGVNDTNTMGLKTPEKKSLFSFQGSLFQDNSGENSGADNGNSHSSDSTPSPSDSSYTSDHLVEESNLSLDSTRNGSSDAQVRSTIGKGTSKLDLSGRKDVTMKMIFQRSNIYKKAKLLVSQNEAYQNDSQPNDFVPDSQAF